MHSTKFDESARILEEKVSAVKGNFTLNDAAAMTGLALDEAKEALNAMMAKYVCRLMVTENGDLIYSFGTSLQRRGEKTTAEKIEIVAHWAWKIFTVIFKAWIAVMLVVYFVIFLVILIGLILASSSKSDDSKSPVKLDGLFDIFISIFQWRTATAVINYHTDGQGYRYQRYEPVKSYIQDHKKSFIASVYDFVFGPPRVELDPLGNEKEVAAYLRREKGIVTPSELTALAGWTRSESEAFLSDCLVRFQGDAVISDNGVVYGRFDQLTRGAGDVKDGDIVYYWDEFEPDYEITGNKGTRNALIIFMNGFNLCFAAAVLWMFYHSNSGYAPSQDKLIAALLGWLPFVFSILFFAVPAMRLPKVVNLKRHRTAMNIRKRIMRVLLANKEKSAMLEQLMHEANAGTEKKLTQAEVEECLRRMMADYEGEIKLADDGKVLYCFPRMAEEFAESRQLKDSRVPDNKLGKLI
jgi:hypothetical protein